jgi:ribosomal protein S18 acetylase RimI-like enzyme
MNDLILRKLTLKDVPALSVIAKKTFYDSFSGTSTAADMDNFLELYYNEAVLAQQIETEGINYFFAQINDAPVGYISFSKENPDFAATKGRKVIELKRLYVLGEYHTKGVAQKLMNLFLEYAIKENFDIAFLGVWEYNYKAQNFYAKYGFNRTNYRHPFPIGNTPQTDIYLLKELK